MIKRNRFQDRFHRHLEHRVNQRKKTEQE
jgi:hypothetical protein